MAPQSTQRNQYGILNTTHSVSVCSRERECVSSSGNSSKDAITHIYIMERWESAYKDGGVARLGEIVRESETEKDYV